MWRRRTDKSEPEPTPVREAREKAQHAKKRRRAVEAQETNVERVSAALRVALERNHFGETLEQAIRRKASST